MPFGTRYTAIAASTQQSTGTTWQTPAITHDVASGDCLAVSCLNTNTAISGVTDTQGNTYNVKASSTGSSIKTYIFECENANPLTVAGADKITITFGNLGGTNTEIAVIIRGIPGAKLTGAIDTNSTPAGANGSSTAPAVTGGTTLAQADEFIVSALGSSNAAGGPTAWGGSFVQAAQVHQTGFAFLTVADQITAATTAINASATLGVSGTWAMCQVGIEEASGGGGGSSLPEFGMDAQAPWSTVESDLSISAIPGWRGYNPPASGVPSSFPGHDAPAPAGVITRVASIKPNLPLSSSDKTKLATFFGSMQSGDAATLWHEGEKSGYTPAQIKAAHATAYDIFKLHAPPGCKYGQISMSYTASGFSSHGPLGQWIAVQTNGQPLDFYATDCYPSAPADATGHTAADAWLTAVVAVVPSAVIAVTETCYTTDNVNGITWSGAQETWFSDMWNWATSKNALWFFPYFNAANNVPWSGNTTACKNELKAIAQASLSQAQFPTPGELAAARDSISVVKPGTGSIASPPAVCMTLNAPAGQTIYTQKLNANVNKGDNMVVCVTVTSGTVAGVQDSQAQQYTLIDGPVGTGLYVFQFKGSRKMLAAHDFITVVLTAGTSSPVNAIGLNDPGASDLDISVSASGTGTTGSVATGTRGQDYEHIIAFDWTSGTGGAPSWNSPMQALATISGNSAGFLTASYTGTVNTTTTTPTATWGTSTTWRFAVVTFRQPLHPAGSVDAVAIAAAVPQGDSAGAAESLGISLNVVPPAGDFAGANEQMQLVITTAVKPWVMPLASDSTLLGRVNFAQSVATLSGIAIGDQFQLYSGDFGLFAIEGRLNSNQSFETTTSPWTGLNGATLSQSTLHPVGLDLGTHSCLITPNGSTALPEMQSELITIDPNHRFNCSARITPSATYAPGARLIIEWYDSTPTLLQTVTGATFSLTSGVTTTMTINDVVPPSNATRARIYAQVQGTPSAATLFYVDIIYLSMINTLLNGGQVYTVTNLSTAFGFTAADFTPSMPALAVYSNVCRQVTTTPVTQVLPSAPFITRSRMPRMHLQNILTRSWISRDVQGVSQPSITWMLNGADTFTGTISPPRSDLLDSTGNPRLVPWQTACYLEESDEIKYGGLLTTLGISGPALTFGFTGFSGYANGMPYEGPQYKHADVDGLDVVRYLWRWLQSQSFADIGLEMGGGSAGVNVGTTVPPPTARTTLKGDAFKNQIAIEVRNLANFKVGMLIAIGDEHTKIRNIGNIPAHVKYHGVGPKPGTKGQFITLSAPLDHYHVDGFTVQTVMNPQPFELDWWNSTDIGSEITSIQAEIPFDFTERHTWNDDRTDVSHKLLFGVPRIGVRHDELRFAEGENIVQAGQVSQDGTQFANHVLALGAGQGKNMLRQGSGSGNGQVRRLFVYTDQTVRRPARLQTIAQKQLRARINIDTVSSVVVRNSANAPFGSFGPGDDILVRLASGWRNAQIWSRIVSMTQDPTTDLMTLSLARSDSFTFMAESGQAGSA